MNTSIGIGIGIAIGLVIGGGGLYFVLSEQILSTDVLPPVKKLQDVIESEKEENKKLKSEIEKLGIETENLQESVSQIKEEKNDLNKQIESYRNSLEKSQTYAKEIENWAEEVELVYTDQVQKMEEEVKKYAEAQALEQSKPKSYIENLQRVWEFSDSRGNRYLWNMPIETYEYSIKRPEPENLFYLQLPDGNTAIIRDHTQFVERSFTKVIDKIYENAGSDAMFVYEVWNIVSQLDVYSPDIGEDPRWALETLSRGGGDCEDLAILIADMIRSSSHTQNWDVDFVYFDADNPSYAQNVNHVALKIDSGDGWYMIEPTADTRDGAYAWNNGKTIFGWWYDV